MPVIDEFLEDLVIKGEASKEYEVVKRRWRLRVLTLNEYHIVYAGAATIEDTAERSAYLKMSILNYALIAINDVPCSQDKVIEIIKKLPPTLIDQLYAAYSKLEIDYRQLIKDDNRLRDLVNDNFSRVRYKVMRAVGALPTEERCLRMRDVQWMWYYRNMIEDYKEDVKRKRNEIEYLAAFFNPEGVQHVQMSRGLEDSDMAPGQYTNADGTVQYTKRPVRHNDNFQQELQEAMGDEEFIDLGSEHQKGNPTESEQDFLSKVINMQAAADEHNAKVFSEYEDMQRQKTFEQICEEAKKAGIDPKDIDFVEVK